jgi:hypothetical protein
MNRTRRNKENRQDRSLRPRAERAIGKRAAGNRQGVVQILANARPARNSQGQAIVAAPARTRSTPEKSTRKSRSNHHCRREFAPARAIWCQRGRRVARLPCAGFALRRADGRDRRRPRSGAPARSAPEPRRAVYGDEPSPPDIPTCNASPRTCMLTLQLLHQARGRLLPILNQHVSARVNSRTLLRIIAI